ncbi:sister chromatid cohesion acetyltransferas-like protein Eco1 [Massarina eburnea CBS 473.64]|uniref:Sister chromatid cohesion acetyltransferas-like protein Eco1 n=1 Tax=Massarina eburnea CBS 473.64 TaxID=1395130 RepID=A0A6A6S510_9PLEO|nr:sister chromatid cohesion acetyltransferas-like protein Eco1 [Massarina eburnea CBS 473.64]
MSSVPVKKVIRTYSRQKKPSIFDQEPPTKRQRVETPTESEEEEAECADNGTAEPALQNLTPSRETSTLPSPSPKHSAAVFSDEVTRSSPPSSPAQSSPPPPRKRRPIFSSQRKRKPEAPATEPLSDRSHNVPSPPKQPAPKKKRLVQMQLDLVAEVTKTCKVCGMDYVPSHADDVALHRKFHAMNVGGVNVPKALSEKLRQNQVWSGADRSFIAVVSRRDTLALRNKASEVLKVVNTELGAVPITDEALWSKIRNPIKAQHPTKGSAEPAASDRFKTYLYIQGQKCVGACLAERIKDAFAVLDHGQDDASTATGQLPVDNPSSSISISNTTDPAILGVSRIWTSNLHRKHGVARQLLESARSDFLYGMTVDKANIAFSQPTESGGKLARKWFGRQAGWHVYID